MSKSYDMVFISPFGPIGIKSCKENIIELKFNSTVSEIKPNNIFLKDVHKQLTLYFNKKLEKFDIPYTFLGTTYQKNILFEVSKINFGYTKTYSDIAVIKKTHPRPVGNACRNNPIQLLIPCHRVVGKRNIGGFSGEDIKKNGNMNFIKKNLLKLEER